VSSDPRVKPLSLSALRFHVPLLVGVSVCAFAGWFELSRARQGHTIAWVYVFEWPGFAIVGVYMWWRIITNAEESRTTSRRSSSPEQPRVTPDDPGLAAWQEYLRDIQRHERVDDVETGD
jgi:hypothetical protein